MKLAHKKQLRQKRRWRVRKKVKGTEARPRLTVYFSNKNIYAQAIDDENGKTLLAVTSLSKEVKDQQLKANIAGATELGKLFGEKAKSVNIGNVVFDRNYRRYHGTVKAFADAARQAGLEF
jgi:large subunit ribosomal protein L18